MCDKKIYHYQDEEVDVNGNYIIVFHAGFFPDFYIDSLGLG